MNVHPVIVIPFYVNGSVDVHQTEMRSRRRLKQKFLCPTRGSFRVPESKPKEVKFL